MFPLELISKQTTFRSLFREAMTAKGWLAGVTNTTPGLKAPITFWYLVLLFLGPELPLPPLCPLDLEEER